MARSNPAPRPYVSPLAAALHEGPLTHEGGPGVAFDPYTELRRAVLTCLLWEDGFYESGEMIGDRIKRLVSQCDPELVKQLARVARTNYKLRHAPLLLARELLRHPKKPKGVDALIEDICLRADEPAELLALYWENAVGKRPLSAQLKRGLAAAVVKFDGYQLAKWQGKDRAVKLRDVFFLTHPKPNVDSQAKIWKQLVDGTLPSPDTWEVALSGGADKREAFTRLLLEKKLGYMALLRNLRNMKEAGVDPKLVESALQSGASRSWALPFRFIAAARACPGWEPMIDMAMRVAVIAQPKLPGRTKLIVDVSASMDQPLSKKSDLRRIDAACALAILLNGVCESVEIYTFSNVVAEVPPRHGMALRDAILGSQVHSSTYLGRALEQLRGRDAERTIVITDEQSADAVGVPTGRGYMLDVAGAQNGVGFGAWTRISGFSEACVEFIRATEGMALGGESTEE